MADTATTRALRGGDWCCGSRVPKRDRGASSLRKYISILFEKIYVCIHTIRLYLPGVKTYLSKKTLFSVYDTKTFKYDAMLCTFLCFIGSLLVKFIRHPLACLSFIFDAAVLVVALDVTIAQRLVARDGLMPPRG